jgi:hypothetical protein
MSGYPGRVILACQAGKWSEQRTETENQMSLSPSLELWAEASIINTGVVSFASNSGRFLSVLRSAAGVVDVTLQPDQGVDFAERAVLISPGNAGGVSVIAVLDLTASTDTVYRVRSFTDAGLAADTSFSILIVKKRI